MTIVHCPSCGLMYGLKECSGRFTDCSSLFGPTSSVQYCILQCTLSVNTFSTELYRSTALDFFFSAFSSRGLVVVLYSRGVVTPRSSGSCLP